jgi:hypothetical protein
VPGAPCLASIARRGTLRVHPSGIASAKTGAFDFAKSRLGYCLSSFQDWGLWDATPGAPCLASFARRGIPRPIPPMSPTLGQQIPHWAFGPVRNDKGWGQLGLEGCGSGSVVPSGLGIGGFSRWLRRGERLGSERLERSRLLRRFRIRPRDSR